MARATDTANVRANNSPLADSFSIDGHRLKKTQLQIVSRVPHDGRAINCRNIPVPLRLDLSSSRRFCDCQKVECISHLATPPDIPAQTCRVPLSAALQCCNERIPFFFQLEDNQIRVGEKGGGREEREKERNQACYALSRADLSREAKILRRIANLPLRLDVSFFFR